MYNVCIVFARKSGDCSCDQAVLFLYQKRGDVKGLREDRSLRGWQSWMKLESSMEFNR